MLFRSAVLFPVQPFALKIFFKLFLCVCVYMALQLLFYLFIMFIFGCVGSSFLCEGFLQLRRVGATLHCSARASHRSGFSLLQSMGSRSVGISSFGSQAVERRLSSCGSRA